MAKKMTDAQVLDYRNAAEAGSIHSNQAINDQHRRAFNYYDMGPMGNEVEGESQVISSDVFDLVEADMPSLVRVFLGANEIMKFTPINTSPPEVKIAEEKTKYINQLIRNQPTSYKTIFDWLKGAEIYKYSAVHFGFEEEDKVKVVEYEGVSNEELELIKVELQLQEQEGATVTFKEIKRKTKDNLNDFTATIKKTIGKYFVRYIDPEKFVISKGATSEEDAQIIGHDEIITKSDLVSMGYDPKLVRGLNSTSASDSTNEQNRQRDQGGVQDSNSNHWTGELVNLETRFVKADRDGDGIAERLKILTVGPVMLEADPYEISPYAVLVSVIMPGQLIGKSRAEIVMETQNIKTSLLRETMMNMHQVNSARMAINENVNQDDMLTQRIGGIVRVKGEANPLQNMAPIPTPFIGDKALAVVQYVDSARAQRTGSLMASQALDTDKLGKETATRFNGIEDASQAKIELVARGHGETGFRTLFVGMLWTVSHFQKEKTEIMVLGKPLTVDPRRWLSDQPIVCNVGLAAGDDQTVLQNMGSLLSITQQLLATGSSITDQKKAYNILSRITKAMNQPDVSEFFNDPEVPEEVLLSQNEQMQQQLQQLQALSQENPLAEAETIKAQGELIKAKGAQELDRAQLAEDKRQFDLKLEEDRRQFNADLDAKTNKTIAELEEKYVALELKFNTDIAGKGQ